MKASSVMVFRDCSVVVLLLTASFHCCFYGCEGCLDEERQVLLQIIDSIGESYDGLQASASSADNCCEWDWVDCGTSGSRVTGIFFYDTRKETKLPWYPNMTLFAQIKELQELHLTGIQIGRLTMPEALCELKNLQELDLSANSMEGSIPPCWANMTSLRILNLSNNRLQGNISSIFGNPTMIEFIDVSHNQFQGLVSFSMFSNFSKLTYLDLSYNYQLEVDSESPTSWVPSFHLQYLSLASCNLNSHSDRQVPSFLINQSALQVLDLSHNSFPGNIPPWLLYNGISVLRLASNKLGGSFPPANQNKTSRLIELDISCNHFNGQLSPNMSNFFPKLHKLNMSSNGLDGCIPPSLGEMPNLQILDLCDNHLIGEIPGRLTRKSPLRYLNLSNNSLHGEMLPRDSNLTQLRWLLLHDNGFTGRIPHCLGEMPNLEHLDLSNNHLPGEIPEKLTRNSALQYLNLSNNSLQGEMLPRDSKMTQLRWLLLHDNHFTGGIPPCLTNSPSLVTLNVRNNRLSGSISSELSLPTDLRDLLLGGNRFEGQIPTQLCEMQNLQLLDLSRNRFSGNIPSCLNRNPCWQEKSQATSRVPSGITIINSVYSLQGFHLVLEFTTKGNLLPFQGVPLYLMTGIDISSNQLTGKIPEEVGDLIEIRSLNLSHNLLSGPFPRSFQNLKILESLDLSHNRLTGKIPYEITRINFLSNFSVAFNNLSGMVPFEQQFFTFTESSYRGNPNLCGPPLERNCTEQEEDVDKNEEEDRIIDNPLFFSSCMVISYALGFWGVIAPLLFNANWRKKYYKFVDRYILNFVLRTF